MRTAALAIALLMSGAAIAQTYETDTTVDTDVGVQPDGDLDVDADVTTDTDMTTTPDATDTPDPMATMPPDTTIHTDATTTHSTTTTTAQTDPMATSSATMPIQTAMAPASGPVVQPSNADPEHDARGIAVISDPAMVPSGWNGVTGTAVGGPLVDPTTGETVSAVDDSHPPCTKDVTDNCLQTYERGRAD